MEGTKITLKAPGSYKLDELKEICNTLGIDMKNADGKKKTKQQLYDDIIIKINNETSNWNNLINSLRFATLGEELELNILTTTNKILNLKFETSS